MRHADFSEILSFLSEPWWAGVQGMLAIAAAAVIGLTVADYIGRLRARPPRAISFTRRQSLTVTEDGRTTVTVAMRPMGPQALYEPKWAVWGLEPHEQPEIPELPPVLSATDGLQTWELEIPADKVGEALAGVLWVVPYRWGSHAAGSRLSLQRGGSYEYWRLYFWRWWPRAAAGRWVKPGSVGPRSPLSIE